MSETNRELGVLLSIFFGWGLVALHFPPPPPLVEKGEATGNAFSSLILAHTFPALSRLRLAGFVPLWTSNVDNFTCLVS